VAQSTVSAPAAAPGAPRPAQARRGLRQTLRAYPEVAAAIALLAVSTIVVVWASTRPGFDPYGWLVWGQQTVTGALNTNAAPSWKPLPYLFTVPYALFGHYELWLWMITSLAMSLSGVLFAGRIAYGLVRDEDPQRHRAALIAALLAAVALVEVRDYPHFLLSFQGDPLVVALCLGAIDCHLLRRPRAALVLGALAALGRPEVWLFYGLYCIWAWRAVPSMRWAIAAAVVLVALLWFGVPTLTSRSPFVAGTNALGSGRALHTNKVSGTVDRFLDLHETPLEILALLSVALAVLRRNRGAIALACGALAWVVVEIAFALHGWPAVPRYMFAPAGVMAVLAAVGVGMLLAERSRLTRASRWAGAVAAVVMLGAIVPAAISRTRIERRDLRTQRARTKQINRLAGAVARLGGAAALRGCGEPLTRLEYQSVLAFTLRVNVAAVGFKYGPAIQSDRPIVLFTPRAHGDWKIKAVHQHRAHCRRLPR